ncbi:MAG: head GIN domain-containing protein [Crocinitomicaceae bacterium]
MKAMGILLLGIGLFTFGSCDEFLNENFEGKGPLVKRTLNVGTFQEVEVSGAMKLFVRQGDKQSVVVKSHDNVLKHLDAKVRSGRLEFDLDRGNYNNLDLSIYITVPTIQYIGASGASEIELQHFDHLNELEFDFSGASSFVALGEDSNIDHLIVDISGAGELSAFKLKSKTIDLDLSGASSCEVFATHQLNIDVSGASEVRYKGNPRIRQDVSGASSVESVH